MPVLHSPYLNYILILILSYSSQLTWEAFAWVIGEIESSVLNPPLTGPGHGDIDNDWYYFHYAGVSSTNASEGNHQRRY